MDKTGPTQKQLDLAARFASVALQLNKDSTIEFKPQTSLWTYDFLAESFGKEFVKKYAVPALSKRDLPRQVR